MRVNVAFGILVGFAMLELLLLQVAVLAHGYAHAITKPAFLPTSAEGGGGILAKRNEDNRICNMGGEITCGLRSFCLADADGFLMCCPDGENCRPPTTCMELTRLSTEDCLAQSGCLACVHNQIPYCLRYYNDQYSVNSYLCTSSRPGDISMRMVGGLVASIPRWEPIHPDSVMSDQPAQPTVTTTAEPGTVAEISSESTESHESVITSSASGGAPTIVTITVNGQYGQTNTSTAASTSKPSTASDNESSQSDTGKKAGIAIGVLLVCGLAAVGAWFVYRRYLKLRRNNQNALWQSPSAGPHHNPNAVELDAMDTRKVEMDHSPASRSEMDASPRPSELASPPPALELPTDKLPSPPVSPLPPLDNGVPNGSRSPVSPLNSPVPEAAPGRYGVGGYLNPEYALRDGLYPDEDDRQVAENKIAF
ncbi:hypothetical protein BFW01_g10642 [Lasiodiplodia theobromae]|uniref:Uncharacterized protein n=1 Tax=Lasiodiplodia theobromae TaxID=45133 RepID=A0A8H7MAI4_9PEZI|nr:hypothetical protein BFW01_g10642 [Lasiodiplodia theobromae]